MYDYLIVGSGLYGSIMAHELTKLGYKILVIEKRNHIGGNIYTENIEGINVHKYGAHIFHTSNERVWNYINQFAEFNDFINSPIAIYKDERYNLPFNMNTFSQLWGINTPEEAQAIIENEKKEFRIEEPKNLEEQAINLVGKTIYEKLIKGYTGKQWGKPCNELPAFIIKRLPVRFTYNNNYFNDTYQGIPIGGYTQIIEKMLKGIDLKLNADFFANRKYYEGLAKKIIYTGPIDQFFDYKFGPLEYRTVKFDTKILDIPDFQGNAVINYTEYEVPYTRIIEHKHFEFGKQLKTVVSYEYSSRWKLGDEPFYPVNDVKNNELYAKYLEESKKHPNVYFGGRLGTYKYLDMDKIILEALTQLDNKNY
ncbi:MAG: UDP-galactopyranose mutase [Bacilli bacterium]|nr:UDP-galactopyranose mutase [Bacilli bacterium]